jgi:hypothetical protein
VSRFDLFFQMDNKDIIWSSCWSSSLNYIKTMENILLNDVNM